MVLESLAPIEEVPIIRTGFPLDLGVALDLRLLVLPDFTSFWGGKDPVARSRLAPVLPMNPVVSSGRVFVPGPLLKLVVEDESTPGKGVRCHHCPVVEGPASDHGIELGEEVLLGEASPLSHPSLEIMGVSFDGLL